MPKPAACQHHWIALEVSAKPSTATSLVVRLGCIMCFKWANATFDRLGYDLTLEAVRAQRAQKKAGR